MIRDDPSRSELIRPGLAVRVDPVRLLYLPVFICECMVNRAKKSQSFVCNQNSYKSQKQYKCSKLSQVKILDRNWWRDGKKELRIK